MFGQLFSLFARGGGLFQHLIENVTVQISGRRHETFFLAGRLHGLHRYFLLGAAKSATVIRNELPPERVKRPIRGSSV